MSSADSPHHDWKVLAAWFVAAALGLSFFLATHARVFPEVAIGVKIGPDEALQRGREFLLTQGYDVADFQGVAFFSGYRRTSSFLQSSVGAAEANRLMREEVWTWGWFCRWFKPEQREEFRVGLDADGQIRQFEHEIGEDVSGARLDVADAQSLAEQYLQDTLRVQLSDYELLNHSEGKRPNRLDHSFVWQRKGFDVSGATYRRQVAVTGDKVGSFSEWLYLPESWMWAGESDYQIRGIVIKIASLVGYPLGIAALIVVLLGIRKRDVRWRFAILTAGTVAGVTLLSDLNWWPLSWYHYQTTTTRTAFVTQEAVASLYGLAPIFLLCVPVAIAADRLSRQVFPSQLPISQAFSPRLWTSRSFVRAILAGVAFAAVQVAYVSAFYLIGQKLGAEVPLESPYDNTISTPFPWVAPLMSGLIAATNEELLYRAFAISLLVRLCKIRWIAVVIPAVLWAFLHSDYPQSPFYIRGLELTVVGIAYGIMFLRYGFFAPFAAHYTYNALIGGIGLVNSQVPYFKFSGVIVITLMLLPLLPAALRLLRGRALLSDREILADSAGVLNVAPTPAALEAQPQCRPFVPLSRNAILVTAAAAVLAGAAFYFFNPDVPPDYARVRVDRWQARRIADAFMREKSVDPAEYHSVVSFRDDSGDEQSDYLFQHTSSTEYKKLRERMPQCLGWYIRYFKPLDATEYFVYILPDGNVFSYNFHQPEDAPGANLPRDEALSLAEDYLRTAHRVDLSHYRLFKASAAQLPKRTDHLFIWEDASAKVADAPCLMWLSISGDVPHGYWSGFRVPETWQRERQKTDWKQVLWTAVGSALGLVCLGVLLRIFIRHFARGSMRWRFACLFGALLTVLLVIAEVNRLSGFWLSYDTATSPRLYLAGYMLTRLGRLAGSFVMLTAAFALCDAVMRWNLPLIHPPSRWFGYKTKNEATGNREESHSALPLRKGWGEGLVIGCLVGVIWFSADSLNDPLTDAIAPMLFGNALTSVDESRTSDPLPARTDAPSLEVGGGMSSYLPVLGQLTSDAGVALVMAGFVVLLLVSYRSLFKGRLLPLWAILSFIFLVSCQEYAAESGWTYPQYVLSAIPGAAGMVVIVYWTVRRLLRDNLASYVVTFSVVFGSEDALRLLWAQNAYERANGLALLAIVGLMIGVGAYLMCTSPAPKSEAKAQLDTPTTDEENTARQRPQPDQDRSTDYTD